ncbi:Probable WRKY transcription factor 3 [Linum grandiflorum]
MADKRDSSSAALPRPTITLPPRPSMDTFFSGGLSPGPMTLVSSFFSDTYPGDSDSRSFSQLLAGAMASPLARPSFFPEFSPRVPAAASSAALSSTEDAAPGTTGGFGFKQSRPMNLVVPRSPLFTVPPGLSPSGLLNSPGFFPPQSPFGMSHQQALAQVTAQAALAAQSQMYMQAQFHPSSVAGPEEVLPLQPSYTAAEDSHWQMPPTTSNLQNTVPEPSEFSHTEKYQPLPPAADKPSDDGYNWRKYGHKPIKGSEYPRSYYKCTHPNCPVKKKVERSGDGQITEIIYKGQHNHELPQSTKRARDNSDQNVSISSQSKNEPVPQGQPGDANHMNEIAPAYSESGRDQESRQMDFTEQPAPSGYTRAEDQIANKQEAADNAPNLKRRQTDAGASEVALPHKTVADAKIIVQTRSEVDLLDDGFRWRKYGQKVVKGNPHPRSYYKCTSVGCNVRKHVERAAADPKAVITTYEGKHNHDVPAGRNSSHNKGNNNYSKIQTMVPDKPQQKLPSLERINEEQRPVLLRLKDEEVVV